MIEISRKEILKCLICNEIASGVHYGVLTCEGCKGFFRRAITTNACGSNNLICYGTPKYQCNIAYRIRHVCQRCRLQKCFNVGMTRKHSKLGRKRKLHMDINQSSNKLIHDFVFSDEEFKERIRQENRYFLREIGIFSNDDLSQQKMLDNELFCKKPTDNYTQDVLSNDINNEKGCGKYIVNSPCYGVHLQNDAILSQSPPSFWNSPTLTTSNETKTILKEGQINSCNSLKDGRHRKFFPLSFPVAFISNSEIDQLFIQMDDFIHLQSREDPSYILFQKFRKLIPQAHMETCIVSMPIMENFFDNKYQNVMVDNDASSVWNVMFHEIEPITNRVVSFCNKLPDFKTVLPFADAVIVIKLALFDIISIRYLRIVDLDRNQLFDLKLTRKIPVDVMAKNPLGHLFIKYFYVAEFIKRELIDPIDDYEMAYLSALCLTLPGWDISQTKIVNSSHLNKLKFFYCLCLYDHLLVRKYKGNTFENIEYKQGFFKCRNHYVNLIYNHAKCKRPYKKMNHHRSASD